MHEGYKSPQPLFVKEGPLKLPFHEGGWGDLFLVLAPENSLYENHTNKFIHQLLFNPAC